MEKFIKIIGVSVVVLSVLIIFGQNAGWIKTNKKTNQAAMITKDDGLIIKDISEGSGKAARIGDVLIVNYSGTLMDGTEFDSSYKRQQPFRFQLGAGQVIRGWEEGFEGMKIGGKRELTIPPDLGYGSNEVGPIPANSTLKFMVELVDITR